MSFKQISEEVHVFPIKILSVSPCTQFLNLGKLLLRSNLNSAKSQNLEVE